MKDYFQDDISISIDFSKTTDILNKHFTEPKSDATYDSRLKHNQRKPEHLQLTIFYPQTDHLFEKFIALKAEGIPILDIINSTEDRWGTNDSLDFSESILVSIESSPYWEHDKKPVILTILNISVLSRNSFGDGDANFQLTENIFQHIDNYVSYGELARNDKNEKFIRNDKNKETDFGPIRFKLSFKHWFDNSTKFNLNISRDAHLTITERKIELTDIELLELGNSLCLLMSFYWQKNIDHFKAQIRIINDKKSRTREIYKYSKYKIEDNEDFVLMGKYETFYDFIKVVKYDKYKTTSELLNELIPRILTTNNIDDISVFMILYNIIEKIRNHCMSSPINGSKLCIKEEFKFKHSKNRTNKFIKDKIKSIIEIVDESDIDAFKTKASDKVSFIKKTSLLDQFNSLLTYLKLAPETYEIDFKKLIQLRNKIYHGQLPTEDIAPYNKQMTVMIYDIILKMIT